MLTLSLPVLALVAAGGGLQCHVISIEPPVFAGYNWTVTPGTQPVDPRTVVRANATLDPTSCCYKRDYPRPNPSDNPVPKPPKQSEAQKLVWGNNSLNASVASAAALPALLEMVEYCAENAVYPDKPNESYHLFNTTNCPGMADVTNNGTLAPWPNASQLVERFSAEV